VAKNIVICCDGTGNEFGESNSNVVKLYSTLIIDGHSQVGYYHPGVGTMGAKNALTTAGKAWTKFRGLAFGYGLSENIADAYEFLMNKYETGDKVFVFGFSRGAYTARALCGLLQLIGLLAPGNEGLIPYAMRLYKGVNEGLIARTLQVFISRCSKFSVAMDFRKTFSRPCTIHFLGAWDTVSSVGWILEPIGLKPGRLPYTFDLGDVSIVRHAVSIDERRAFFRQNLVREAPGRDVKQVWFAGVHSDVGGGYPEAESGLSKLTLRWMMREARIAGLIVDPVVVGDILGGAPAYSKPLSNAPKHNSLTPRWWLGEFWPKWTMQRVSPPGEEPARFRGWPRANFFRRRTINPGACIHQSVLDRRHLVPGYHPSNLPTTFTIEQEPVRDQYPVHLDIGQIFVAGIHSGLKWEDTALKLVKGERYRFEASGRWYDANIPSGPAGYASPNSILRLLEWLRRVPSANWFALIGAIGQDMSLAFVIGENAETDAHEDGILHCFANDLAMMYWNNTGWVKLTVTRIR